MPKLAINIIRWNHPKEMLQRCIDCVLGQDFEDFELTLTENGSIQDPYLKDFFIDAYHHPKFKVADNGRNFGFAGGHNRFFKQSKTELVMPLNPDAFMQPSFLKNMVKAFDNPKVGAVEGKMLKPEHDQGGKHLIDGTGIIIYRSRRARERGQLQIDNGQFDRDKQIFGVSGSAPIYRKSALEASRLYEDEYFDPDFFAYWEDLDLAWRMRLMGYESVYVPEAVIYHSRNVGQSRRGYKNPIEFYKHHTKFSSDVRRWNWRNHLFAIIKNDFGWNLFKGLPFIIFRETVMFGWIIIFETKTLKAVPDFFRLLPKMLQKRKIIQQRRIASSAEMEIWFK